MDTYMVDAWFFPFFLTTSFHFISILYTPTLTAPAAVATGPQLFFFYYHCYYPFPHVFSKDLADHYQFYFTVVRRYAFDVFY